MPDNEPRPKQDERPYTLRDAREQARRNAAAKFRPSALITHGQQPEVW